MSTKVWYKLHKPQELGNVSIPDEKFNDDFDIYDLQEKIHAHHHTEHARNVGNVRVYAAGADPSKDEALDPGSPVPSNTTSTAPLVVVFVGVWSEVPPPGLSRATRLFEREEAAKALREALLPTSGLLVTPVLDQAKGAGKTTLVWRFREILKAAEADSSRKLNDHRMQQLYDAVYLSVPFTDEEKTMAASLSLEDDDQFNNQTLNVNTSWLVGV